MILVHCDVICLAVLARESFLEADGYSHSVWMVPGVENNSWMLVGLLVPTLLLFI